jgi:hypothetical protein
VPLSDLANEILAGIAKRDGYEQVFGRTLAAGFSGWSSGKAEFDAVVKIGDWRVHDLRRTVRTGIDKLGTLPHICEAVLNHLLPKLVRTYNRNTYENEKRKALDTWAHQDHRCPSYRGQCGGAQEKAALRQVTQAATRRPALSELFNAHVVA